MPGCLSVKMPKKLSTLFSGILHSRFGPKSNNEFVVDQNVPHLIFTLMIYRQWNSNVSVVSIYYSQVANEFRDR